MAPSQHGGLRVQGQQESLSLQSAKMESYITLHKQRSYGVEARHRFNIHLGQGIYLGVTLWELPWGVCHRLPSNLQRFTSSHMQIHSFHPKSSEKPSHYSTLLPSSSSLVAQTVKHLPAMQETRIQSLHWEYTLEKGIATPSSILVWKIPWAGGL